MTALDDLRAIHEAALAERLDAGREPIGDPPREEEDDEEDDDEDDEEDE